MEVFSRSGSSGIMPSDDSRGSTESNEASSESGHKIVVEKGSKKKKGKSSGNAKSGSAETGVDQDYIPTKSKKNQRRGKDTSLSQVSDRKDSVKVQENDLNVPSEEWVIQKIMMLNPDFEEQGPMIFHFIRLATRY